MKQGHVADISWGLVLWMFRCFCIVWTVVVVLLAARAVVMFVE